MNTQPSIGLDQCYGGFDAMFTFGCLQPGWAVRATSRDFDAETGQ